MIAKILCLYMLSILRIGNNEAMTRARIFSCLFLFYCYNFAYNFQDKKMFKEKIKQSVTKTFKLLWSFKWYVGLYLIYYFLCISLFFEIPEADDPILNYEYTRGAWNYINQEVYIESLKLSFVIDTLIFLIGTSNMRNHPLLAKIIFVFPWIDVLLGLIVGMCE
jgi:hypothetical protein